MGDGVFADTGEPIEKYETGLKGFVSSWGLRSRDALRSCGRSRPKLKVHLAEKDRNQISEHL